MLRLIKETLYKRRIILMILFSLFLVQTGTLYAQDNTYPTANRLFHIERSKNKNLVCYDVNLSEGKLNTKKPLYIYWVNREETPGETKELSAMQKRLAYGYKLISEGDDYSEITLSAYSGRTLKIQQKDGKYVCTLIINNEPAILKSLYVKAKESNSLSVEYVELRGVSLKTQQTVSERVSK